MNAPVKSTKDSKVTTLDDEPTADANQAAEAAPIKAGSDETLSGNRRTLTIHQDKGEGGSDDVFVGVNGVGYTIKRGMPVSVPVEVIHVLENSMQTVYDSKAQGGSVGREVPRFAFSVK